MVDNLSCRVAYIKLAELANHSALLHRIALATRIERSRQHFLLSPSYLTAHPQQVASERSKLKTGNSVNVNWISKAVLLKGFGIVGTRGWAGYWLTIGLIGANMHAPCVRVNTRKRLPFMSFSWVFGCPPIPHSHSPNLHGIIIILIVEST